MATPPGGAGARSSAFTLIELLVVTAILGLVIGVIAACLAAGLKVWDQARTFHTAEAEAFIAMDIIEKDVSSAFCFRDIPFAGGSRQLSCAAVLTPDRSDGLAKGPAEEAEGRPSDWRIGTVRYALDAARGELFREDWAYSPSERTPKSVRSERMMRGIGDLTFGYLRAAADPSNRDAWGAEWNSATNLPVAVRVTVKGREGDEPLVMERLILLPAAQVFEEARP